MPHTAAMFPRIASICGAIFGRWAMIVASMCSGRMPFSRILCTTCPSSTMLSAPAYAGSLSGNRCPMSGSAAAPSSASMTACRSTSASEWPSSPRSNGMSTPPRISFLPSTSRCVSKPVPYRVSMRSARAQSAGVVSFSLSALPMTSVGL